MDPMEQVAQAIKDADERYILQFATMKKEFETESEKKDATIADLAAKFELQEQTLDDLKKLYKATIDRTYDKDANYTGMWNNEQQAKQFGLYIMHTAKSSQRSAKAQAQVPMLEKALEDAGFDIKGHMEKSLLKAQTEGITSEGSALVPDNFHANLIALVLSYGEFRAAAQQVPIGATDIWPKLDSDVTVYPVGEGAAITLSDVGLSNVKLVPTKLAALVAISSELDQDSAIAVGELVGSSMARSHAKAEDEAGFLGDGSDTYWKFVGITGAFQNLSGWANFDDSSVTGGLVTAAGHLWTDITIGNFNSMLGALPSYARSSAKFYTSSEFYNNVMVPILETAGGLTKKEREDKNRDIFRGHEVVFVDVMPSVTAVSQQCVFLGDLSMGAYFGVNRNLTIDTDESVYFASDQLAIRSTERFGINVFGYGSTTVAGPIISLVTAAD